LEEECEEQQEHGLSHEDAQRAARRSLGNVVRVQEQTRVAWGFAFWETLLQDFRIAVRTLRKAPGFSLVAISVLGLGIGASTAVFSVMNAVLLKPLAFRDPDRIVALSTLWKATNAHSNVSLPDYEDWRSQSTSFDAMAYYGNGELAIGLESGAFFANSAVTSDDFFRILGVAPVAGRLFRPEEIAIGSGGAAIVGSSFSQTHFGGSQAALGKTIRVADHILPIVGVMPAGFQFPDKTEIWIPAQTVFRDLNPNRGGHNYHVVGLLKSGVSLEHAQADLTVIGSRLERQYMGSNRGESVAVTTLGKEMVRGLTTMLYLLLAAVCVLLLISCGNVANLLLAKAATRTQELGVRVALGAARGRILRQLATESLVLGTASGLVGLFIARLGILALVALGPADIPRLAETGVDPVVLAFAAALTLMACILFGMTPALRASRVDVNHALKQAGSRGPRDAGSTLRSALVVAEVAFSVVLLIGAGLLIRSFAELNSVALGFQTHRVLVMETSNATPSLVEAQRVVRSYRTLLEQAAHIPGIVSVGATRIPPGEVGSDGSYAVDGKAALSTTSPQAVYSILSSGAFAVLGIPIRRGRDFSDADQPEAPFVAIVNEALARQSFPGRDPIGHTIVCGMDSLKPMTIVGVVGDTRQRGPGQEGMAEVYMPYEQHPGPSTSMRILARTSVPPEAVIDALRQMARRIAPDMPVKFSTMEERISENVATPRYRTLLLAVFAAIAVVLTMAGVYGVMSFLINQRTQEIGLRMALGANAAQVMNMVFSQGVRMALVGLVVGLAGAAAATRLLRSMLFEVKPFDPLTYASVAALVVAVTLASCFLPARRASRIDPMLALRRE
jgi:predicted permease